MTLDIGRGAGRAPWAPSARGRRHAARKGQMQYEPIYITYDEMHADRIRGILAGAGIACAARSMRVGGYEGIRLGPLGEIHILVPGPYTGKALRLIQEAIQDGALWPMGAPYLAHRRARGRPTIVSGDAGDDLAAGGR